MLKKFQLCNIAAREITQTKISHFFKTNIERKIRRGDTPLSPPNAFSLDPTTPKEVKPCERK
jgi:hypothetical protein